MARSLVVTGPEGEERTVALAADELLIGRRDECAIRAHDDTVGRRHARITSREGSHWIEDLGSDNGTWVNGERITRRALVANDVIQCGRLKIKYVDGT